ncbi:hypothetical protein PI125_g23239 [Phytophthora idaei]|nr:hypothetical protein PI125_g23239 [Phytophthora idaei]KAG3128815.1 hypothetical protein PI126_g21230 [Phytophthora idaei]
MGGWMRIEMKRALIKHNYERPGLSQRELAAWAKVQFKLKKAPAQTTVSDILKHAATIMDEAYGDGKSFAGDIITIGETSLGVVARAGEPARVCLARADQVESSGSTVNFVTHGIYLYRKAGSLRLKSAMGYACASNTAKRPPPILRLSVSGASDCSK